MFKRREGERKEKIPGTRTVRESGVTQSQWNPQLSVVAYLSQRSRGGGDSEIRAEDDGVSEFNRLATAQAVCNGDSLIRKADLPIELGRV